MLEPFHQTNRTHSRWLILVKRIFIMMLMYYVGVEGLYFGGCKFIYLWGRCTKPKANDCTTCARRMTAAYRRRGWSWALELDVLLLLLWLTYRDQAWHKYTSKKVAWMLHQSDEYRDVRWEGGGRGERGDAATTLLSAPLVFSPSPLLPPGSDLSPWPRSQTLTS